MCSSPRGKARARNAEASIEGVVGLVSHLSKAASAETHVDCGLSGLGCVLSLVVGKKYSVLNELGSERFNTDVSVGSRLCKRNRFRLGGNVALEL